MHVSFFNLSFISFLFLFLSSAALSTENLPNTTSTQPAIRNPPKWVGCFSIGYSEHKGKLLTVPSSSLFIYICIRHLISYNAQNIPRGLQSWCSEPTNLHSKHSCSTSELNVVITICVSSKLSPEYHGTHGRRGRSSAAKVADIRYGTYCLPRHPTSSANDANLQIPNSHKSIQTTTRKPTSLLLYIVAYAIL